MLLLKKSNQFVEHVYMLGHSFRHEQHEESDILLVKLKYALPFPQCKMVIFGKHHGNVNISKSDGLMVC